MFYRMKGSNDIPKTLEANNALKLLKQNVVASFNRGSNIIFIVRMNNVGSHNIAWEVDNAK